MRKVLMLFAILQLAACASVDQTGLSALVAQTVTPGMPMDQALARMSTEGFSCDTRNGNAASSSPISCTRSKPRMISGACTEQAILTRNSMARTVAAVDVTPIQCTWH